MKLKMKKSWVGLCAGILLAQSVGASTYYVSKSGDDSNSGTEEASFLTISAASAVMVAGDTCFIKAGTYRETLTSQNNGTSTNPICYMAYATDSVTVSAVEELTGWSVHDGAVYKASVIMAMGIERRMFYFNSELMDIARWPNNADFDPYTVDTKYVSGGNASYITYTGIPDFDWTGGYMWYLGAHSGASWTRQITASSTTRIDFIGVDITSWPFNPHNPTVLRNNHYGIFYLFGILDALDYDREWFYNSSSDIVYFQAPGGIDPSGGIVEYAVRENAIYLNHNYIYINGINAFGGKVEIEGDNCIISNGRFVHSLQRLDELNNTDAQIGEGAITIEGSNALIENNIVEYSATNGIAALASWNGSQNNTIRNNVVRNINTIGNHSCGIRSNCSGTIIQKNTIYTCGRDGVYVSGANADISYNDVYDCMKINNDGGVFYTVGNADEKNSVIHHNWFHDSWGPDYADGRAAGIYLDNNSKGYDVHHNVVWNVTWAAIQINWDNWHIDIVNNTLWEAEGAMGRWENGYTIDDINIVNNYASSGEWIGTNVQNNLIDSENQFVFANGGNFIPEEGSVLIDQGIVYGDYTTGCIGSAPDIGAYERGGDYWLAGTDWVGADSLTLFLASQGIDKRIGVYPNPAQDLIHINLGSIEAAEMFLSIYNMAGELVYSEFVSRNYIQNGIYTLRSEKIKSGLYIIKIQAGSSVYNAKVVVQ